MIEDFNLLEDGLAVDADICIVGAGVAGLTVAREFLGSRDKVVVVETGGFAIEDETRQLNQGEVSGLPFGGLHNGRARALGGTSNLWGGQCVPLDPIDFEQRQWVPFSGWPVSMDVLAQYYEQAKQRLWIPPDEYEQSVWKRFGLPGLEFDPAVLHIAHTIFIAQHNLGRRYRTELTNAGNVRVLLHAHVVRLQADEGGRRVKQATVKTLSGKQGQINAQVFVLCSGAIENARSLLLMEGNGPDGLGAATANVGRFLQDHPVCRCAEIESSAPRVLQDHFNLFYSPTARTLRYGQGTKYLPKLALSEAVQRRDQVLNCVGQLEFEWEEGSAMHAIRDLVVSLHLGRRPQRLVATSLAVARGAPMLARNAFRFAARGHTPAVKPARISLEAISEQAPDPESRITLGQERDEFGLRRARVDWRLQDIDWRTVLAFAQGVKAEFRRLGLAEVKIADWLTEGDFARSQVRDSYHMAGTTRMARCARDGVVDTDGKVFGVEGLYLAGTSVFPTSGAVNPVLTITALALRLADHLKRQLRADLGGKAAA